uniref:DNA polymerase n=1 Tax=Fagus sylvatica TaxID=28930 RepID=A0A2N9GNH1_FAGSY
MKFRHPVPDTFSPRKSDRIGLQNQNMDKLTCMANDFQADPNCDASLSSPIWISSTIPADWIWQFPSEFEASSHQDVCCVKRQSVCELEGDASIDDILNQQFKNYSSLSQTHSEVKMVQSLVPIWEEEYERTGMRDVAMPSDPSKPLPNDVLRTLSLGLEFESKLIELCGATENTLALNPLEKNVKLLQSMTSATDEGNLVGLGHTNPDNRDGESLKYSKEKDIMGSLSPQRSIRKEEIPTEGRDTSIKPLSIDEMWTSAIIETLDPSVHLLLDFSYAFLKSMYCIQAIDEEALGLLRWLATSQAGEDINSDDELVCETILSPLLPATTIDKVLEKANMDYESESQKECQDILDSIDDLSDFEGLKEGASHCSDQNHSSISSSEKMIPQIDGSADDLFSVPCNCAGRFMKNADTDVHDLKESCTLVGCSVRDLMRRKRSYRVEPPDDGSGRTKKALLEGEQREGLLLGHKQLNDELDKNPIESLNLRQSLVGQQTNFQEAYEVKAAHSDSSMYGKLPLLYSSDSLSQASRLKDGNFGSHEKVGPWICKPKTIDSAASMGHREIDNVKESGFGVTAIAIERFQQIVLLLQLFANGLVELEYLVQMFHESGHKDEPSLVWVHDKSFENLVGTNVTTDSMGLQNQNCSGGKHVRDFILSGFGSSKTVVVNTQEKCMELIGMTFCKKPPIADWTDGASENASFTLTTSNPEEDNFGGSSGRVLDDFLPFFEGECREEKELMDKHARISDSNSDQVVIGVPTHCQNDGSYLYLLTPVLSPPSTDSVYRWLLCDEKGAPGGNNVASVDSSPLKVFCLMIDDIVICKESGSESGSRSHVKPILDHLYQENPRIFDREMSAFGDGTRWDGKSKPTPLSQSGFRDPASVGGGQQLTLLSIEVQAESRGDLRPNPRFDAINVIALAIQNDTDSIPEVYVLLRSKTEAFKRSLDGTSGCKMLVFSEEKYLFSHFMKIVCSSDPDIIMGWDIQGGSLGFLAERASHLGIGLLNNISRTPSEIKIAAGDLDIPEKGNFDNLIPEQSNTDPVILEDAIIEDEWGRTHASGVHVGGRIVLNIWRLMRGEVKLNMYTIEAVAEAVLRRKNSIISSQSTDKMINQTSELARVFGIDFFSVLSRGSQYRVESMLLRLAHTQNYLAISPGSQQVASQPAMECLPLVMEPESGFYADPVVVLDFQSLYPSMIIAYNLCFSTCLGKSCSFKGKYTWAAGFSGRMPCAELADSIVQCGRSTLEKAISFVNAHDKWKAKVIYGDTDSLFVLLKGRTVKESFRIGNEIASAITAMNPKPVIYETPEQTAPVFDAKGIETDISEVKAYLQRQWTRILSARVSLQDFVFAKEVRLGTYCTRGSSSLPPAAIVATKAMRADLQGKTMLCRANTLCCNPWGAWGPRVFGLVGADLIQWFIEMPRPAREAFAKRPFSAPNPHRTRIDYYYLSKHCILCGELVQASARLCNQCLQKGAAAATAVIGRTSKLEREMQHLAAICRHCGGGDWVVESGVKCTSLACSVFYERQESSERTTKSFFCCCR